MGIALDRFYLYPPAAPELPALLVRVVRPAAPNAAEPAIDLAEALADAKADALAWAWLVAAGAGEARPPVPLGMVSSRLDDAIAADDALVAFHGGRVLDLWWTAEEERPTVLAIGPGADEAAFWRWLAASLDDPGLAGLRRPAAPVRVQLVTEADARLVDVPLWLVDDVDWLTAEEFAHLYRGGLAALTARPPATAPVVTEAEFLAVKRGLVERSLERDLARGNRRSAAFRMSDLARFDPPAALALIERLAGSLKRGDERKDIAWALAYALFHLRREPGRAELLERWRTAPDPFRRGVLAELERLER